MLDSVLDVEEQPAIIKVIGDYGMSTAKEQLTKLIQEQPDDSSPEEIVRELAFHIMVQRGLADSSAGRTMSNKEMGRRIRAWQK